MSLYQHNLQRCRLAIIMLYRDHRCQSLFVCLPVWIYPKVFSKMNTVIIVLCALSNSFCFAIFPVIDFGGRYEYEPGPSSACSICTTIHHLHLRWWWVDLVSWLFHVFHICKIFMHILSARRRVAVSQTKTNLDIYKSVCILFLAHMLFQTPISITTFVDLCYGQLLYTQLSISGRFTLLMLNSVVNPLILGALNKSFRDVYTKFLARQLSLNHFQILRKTQLMFLKVNVPQKLKLLKQVF